ncbi:MAG: type II toxin-antitoxin system VapC family toxin [Chloroflexota bacterium]
MAHYFLDSSAIAKRYMIEPGSNWVEALCRNDDNTIILAEITIAEVASTFARASRGRRITEAQRVEYLDLFTRDCDHVYQLFPVHRFHINRAVALAQRYYLRGYDAVQLACALRANELLNERELPPLVFVSADRDLIVAAAQETLAAENPNDR